MKAKKATKLTMATVEVETLRLPPSVLSVSMESQREEVAEVAEVVHVEMFRLPPSVLSVPRGCLW